MVSQQLIKELQNIIKEDCGKNLDMKDIARIANDMVAYFDLLAKIHHRETLSVVENPDLPQEKE